MGHFHRRNPNHQLVTIDNILEQPIIVTNNSYQYIDNITSCFNPSLFSLGIKQWDFSVFFPSTYWSLEFPSRASSAPHLVADDSEGSMDSMVKKCSMGVRQASIRSWCFVWQRTGISWWWIYLIIFSKSRSNSVTIHKACWEWHICDYFLPTIFLTNDWF